MFTSYRSVWYLDRAKVTSLSSVILDRFLEDEIRSHCGRDHLLQNSSLLCLKRVQLNVWLKPRVTLKTLFWTERFLSCFRPAIGTATGCASDVSEGGLCLSSYPWKNPHKIILFVKSNLCWYIEVSKLIISGTAEVVKCLFYGWNS